MNNWQAQDQTGSKYIGIIEFQDPRDPDEYINFEVVKNSTHFIFGNCCNIGLLESGNFEIDPAFSDDENLQELILDLESYYQDGPNRQSANFSCNDRM